MVFLERRRRLGAELLLLAPLTRDVPPGQAPTSLLMLRWGGSWTPWGTHGHQVWLWSP